MNDTKFNKLNLTLTKSNDQNIIVNYNCFCSKSFYHNDKILYILPCCHMIHEHCFNDYILKQEYKKLLGNKNENLENKTKTNNNLFNNSLKCPFCENNIRTVLTEFKINSKKYHQYKIDIKSVKIDNSAHINYMILPLGIIKLTSFMNKLILANTENDLLNIIEYVFSSLNLKINIIDNTKNNPIIIRDNKISWKKKKG